MKIEIKSVLIGVLLTVNVLLLLGLNSNDEESQIGRYQPVNDSFYNVIYVIDTTDGEPIDVFSSKSKKMKNRIKENRIKKNLLIK